MKTPKRVFVDPPSTRAELEAALVGASRRVRCADDELISALGSSSEPGYRMHRNGLELKRLRALTDLISAYPEQSAVQREDSGATVKQQKPADQAKPVTEEAIPPPRQFHHDTGARGGQPCRRCGMSYSPKTAYIPCFVEGDTLATWLARHAEALGDAPIDTQPRAATAKHPDHTFTAQEVLTVLRNMGHDVECGACMAIAFTGVGMPGDEHTCAPVRP